LDKVTPQDEARLKDRIEHLVGGKVIDMDRQVRWRPSWYVSVRQGDTVLPVYVRGDRQSDIVPFPELKREADILRVLEQQGIPVPHIYGMCDNPVAIIMEASEGTRDVSTARSDEERRDVARQYIRALAAMHQLPLETFAEIGLSIPQGADEVALAGLEAYAPLYIKHKVAPDPFLEFAMKWLRSNVPCHRQKPAFIAFDAGQFLFDQGTITALYDFEFSMIGDPMTDLATMAMRQSYEYMGDETAALCDYYGQITGSPVDKNVIRYHHALFATVACMQFVGVIANPQPGDPHDIYLEWTLALRRSLINALAENMAVKLKPPQPLKSCGGGNENLYTMLGDTVGRIVAAEDMGESTKNAAVRLIEYASRARGDRRCREVRRQLSECWRDGRGARAIGENSRCGAGRRASATFLESD